MKKLMLFAVAAICALSLSAQSFEDFFSNEKSTEKVTFGFRIGLNINGIKNNVDNNVVKAAFGNLPYRLNVHNKAGINLGVNVDIPILRNLWVTTGAYYTSRGANLKFTQDFSQSYPDILDEYSAKITTHNVRIPVQASYRFNFSKHYQLQVNLGPYFAYGFGGKATIKNDMNKETIGKIDMMGNTKDSKSEWVLSDDGVMVSSDDEIRILGPENINYNNADYIKPFDMGIAFGAGITLDKKYYAGFNYDGGLVNVNGKRAVALNHYSLKNHTFSINFGYNF